MVIERILFVCTGNICRSPVAAAMFASIVASSGVEASSAGVSARAGYSPPGKMLESAYRLGVDVSGHRSRVIVAEELEDFAGIFCMEFGQARALVSVVPEAFGKIFVLPQFVRSAAESPQSARQTSESVAQWIARLGVDRQPSDLFARGADWEVADPFGAHSDAYDRCVSDLGLLVTALAVAMLPAGPIRALVPRRGVAEDSLRGRVMLPGRLWRGKSSSGSD